MDIPSRLPHFLLSRLSRCHAFLIENLESSELCFIFADEETKLYYESSIRRESEYTFKIYSNEEERLHIHVTHERCEAKYWLEPEVELAKNTGFSEHELNKIKKLVEKYADNFKEQFRQHIGKRIND